VGVLLGKRAQRRPPSPAAAQYSDTPHPIYGIESVANKKRGKKAIQKTTRKKVGNWGRGPLPSAPRALPRRGRAPACATPASAWPSLDARAPSSEEDLLLLHGCLCFGVLSLQCRHESAECSASFFCATFWLSAPLTRTNDSPRRPPPTVSVSEGFGGGCGVRCM
jgi:hypothetical protein